MIFPVAFFRFAPGAINVYAVTLILKIFDWFFYSYSNNSQRLILCSFHYFLRSSFDVVINLCQALRFNGGHRGGCHRDVTNFLSCVTPKRVEIEENGQHHVKERKIYYKIAYFQKNRSSSLDAEIFLRIKNQKRYNSAAELGPRFLFPITYRRIFRYFGAVDMNSSVTLVHVFFCHF